MPPNPRRVLPGVAGTASRALEEYVRRLERRIDDLGGTSDDITNESGVAGATVTNALDALKAADTALAATKLDDWATPDDNTDLNASTSRHGLLRKLDGSAAKALLGDGSWGNPTPAGHHATHESGGSDAIKLDDLAAPDDNTDLNTSTSKHGLAPKGTSGSTLFWRQDWTLASPAGGSAIPSELWTKPSSAHASDDEFDTASLTSYTLYDSSGNAIAGEPQNTTIDPYSNDTTHHHADANVYKPDWLTLKVRNNNAQVFYVKAFTPATNVLVWSRIGTRYRASSAASDVAFGICLMAATSGHPDPANYVLIEWAPAVGTDSRILAGKVVASALTTAFLQGPVGFTPEYFGIHKLGTTYHFWGFIEGGHKVYMGNTSTFSPTIAYVGFTGTCNGSTPGNGIVNADFLRFVDSATYLP